jgi:hypothetical protein
MNSISSQQVNLGASFNATSSYPVKGEDGSTNDSHYMTKKEALIELIAQEMVASLMGDEALAVEEDDYDDILEEFQAKLAKGQAKRKKKKRRAAAKRKPKQEAVRRQQATESSSRLSDSHYQPVTEGQLLSSSVIQKYETKIRDYQDFDDNSFAGLDIEELTTSSHKSSSSTCNSNKTPYTDSGSTEPMSMVSTMSVEEIRNFVMANIPEAVRDQIPPEAWGEIFRGSSTGSKESSKRSAVSKPRTRQEDAPIDSVVHTSIDDVSVMSDVTGFITAFPDGRKVESRLSMSRIDIKSPDPSASEVTDETSTGTELSSLVDRSSNYDAVAVSASLPNPGAPKSVQFSTVTLRYYERILSDNPAVQSGPAIGIGWRYKRGGMFDIATFEQGRTCTRTVEELILTREDREKMLRDAGIPQKDIVDMVRVILKSKNQRKQTISNLHTRGVEEAVESARKRVGRLLSFGRQSDIL